MIIDTLQTLHRNLLTFIKLNICKIPVTERDFLFTKFTLNDTTFKICRKLRRGMMAPAHNIHYAKYRVPPGVQHCRALYHRHALRTPSPAKLHNVGYIMVLGDHIPRRRRTTPQGTFSAFRRCAGMCAPHSRKQGILKGSAKKSSLQG